MTKMNSLNRRRFFQTAAGFAGGIALNPMASALAAETGDRFSIALSQYSLRAMFKDGSLDPLDFPAFTVDKFGIKAIDLWEGGLPKDKLDDSAYLAKLRKRSEDAGTDCFLLMAGVLEVAAEKREASLAGLMPSLDRAQQLGCDFVRVFLRVPGDDEAAGVDACVESLKPYAEAAAKRDLIVAIEPGASPLSQRGAFLAKVATKLAHPACRLMPDFGKLKDNVYDGTEAMLPHTATISCKMHSFGENGNQPDFDYGRLMKMIAASDYRGYLAIEWEGHALQPVEGVLASKKLIEQSLAAI